MTFRRIDATNAVDFDPWFDLLRRSEELRGDHPSEGWHPDEIRARAVRLDAPSVEHLVVHEHDGDLVALSSFEVDRDDNTHMVRVDFHVDPDLRRRGHGTRAVAEVETYARSLGRRELIIAPREGIDDLGRGANRSFAPRVGYTLHDEAARRDLAWPRPVGELDRLWDSWVGSSTGYDVRAWRAPTPDEHLAGLAHLMAIMPVEAPHGDLDVEEETWDADRMRAFEERTDAMSRDLYVAVAAREDTGQFVGFSHLTCSRLQPGTAYQWNTLVQRADRGHRLGGLMKVANLRQFAERGTPTRRITTFNSVTNTPMIDVNEALGARVGGAIVEWRKALVD